MLRTDARPYLLLRIQRYLPAQPRARLLLDLKDEFDEQTLTDSASGVLGRRAARTGGPVQQLELLAREFGEVLRRALQYLPHGRPLRVRDAQVCIQVAPQISSSRSLAEADQLASRDQRCQAAGEGLARYAVIA